jgi:hypothetical protein
MLPNLHRKSGVFGILFPIIMTEVPGYNKTIKSNKSKITTQCKATDLRTLAQQQESPIENSFEGM